MDDVKPVGRPSRFSFEFKKMVADEVNSGKIVLRDAARKYGVSNSTVHQWRHQFDCPEGKEKTLEELAVKSRSQRERLLERENEFLKQELGHLYVEVRFLKKALKLKEYVKSENFFAYTPENYEASDEDSNS